MTPLAPLTLGAGTTPTTQTSTSQAATNAFGLSFESLLKIILTQLTYQDPLKPMDNFEFVSQLAQFSQIQQGQAANDRLDSLVSGQATSQAVGILGGLVDVADESGTRTGKVTAVTFQGGAPRITITTPDDRTFFDISPDNITQVRQDTVVPAASEED